MSEPQDVQGVTGPHGEEAATLTDEEIETREVTSVPRAAVDDSDTGDDSSDTGDDSGDEADPSDTGDDAGDEADPADTGDDSGDSGS